MKPEKQNTDLYGRAREILRAEPTMGKGRLAKMLGVKTPCSRRLIHRFRGETQGHSNDPVYAQVRQLKEANPEWGAGRIAQELHLTVDHALLHLARWTGAQSFGSASGSVAAAPAAQPPPAGQGGQGATLHDVTSRDTRDLAYMGERIRTLEDLLIYAEVNTAFWEVERWVCNKWEVGARNPATGEILTAPLFQIKAWLRRKVVEASLREFVNNLLEEFKKEAPVFPMILRPSHCEGMLEVSLMDIHYTKVSLAGECGRDYNPEIAERMFKDAVEDLLAKAAGCRISRILFPVGNDFLNSGILGRTTTAGTPVDSTVGWKQGFAQAWRLLAKTIEGLRKIAPVHVAVIAGNHDEMATVHIGEVLSARFCNSEGITVDNGPATRKYVTHGKCLLGLTHGHCEKVASLALLLATERPKDWANSTPATREFHIGHLHHKKSLKLMPALDVGGVLVRVVPSLCPPDAWHASHGYGGKLAAEAYYWDPEQGVTVTFIHSPV
ncbi:MAG TPA: hypothetical protein VN829_08070 [Dongiaceae bacterium]|nr:hypothetical protein [Dongiaceae bacterium]HXR37722.1 hypothetical protein [Terracidiphilus sp.]